MTAPGDVRVLAVPELAIAFDVDSLERAIALDASLGEGPEYAKVGLQLFTAAGPEAVRALARRGRRVFLDLKLHDIPNTVRGAAAEASRLGAVLLTVHAAGGEEMICAAVEGAAEGASMAGAMPSDRGAAAGTRIVAVTVLTSLDPCAMPPGFVRPFPMAEAQANMLAMAERAGALGIVCSAADLPSIRVRHPQPFYAVTPGIRPAGAASQDQKRVATIAEAAALGASLLVLGRAITAAPDPRAALALARSELESRSRAT